MISSQNIASQRTNESLGEDAKSPCKIYETKTQQGLESISNPATQLVVWERSISSNLDVWLQNLHPSHLPSLRVLVEPSKFRTAVRLKLGRHIKSDQVLWDLFIEDVESLVFTYAKITSAKLVDVRLEKINDNACCKFHRDFVKTRLLTTYRGPNTEWIRPEYSEQAICQQKHYIGPIEKLPTYGVLIFRGNVGKIETGIVHRSPPIENTGHNRLLLCLNEESETSPGQWIS